MRSRGALGFAVAALLACAIGRNEVGGTGRVEHAPSSTSPSPSPSISTPAPALTSTPTSTPTPTPTSTSTPTPTPTAIPPPAPAPLAPPPAADLADPLELLWAHRLAFTRDGEPLVTIRLMEGQREIAFRARAPGRITLRGGTVVEVPAGARLTVRAREAAPAIVVHHALLAEAPLAARAALDEARRTWAARGVPVRSRVTGTVYGVGGRVVDARRELLVAEGDGSLEAARATGASLRERFGEQPALSAEVVARPRGTLELRGEGGAPLGEADAALWLDVAGDAGFLVEGVEHDRGPRGRAREDRAYGGRLFVTLDAHGGIAAIHGVPLEELLRGLVPSEMPASSPLEALKAQAVTARSNVLAQLGARHSADPFMLCAEVHCQAYRGDGARTSRTDEAVRTTRGETLFGAADQALVDAVYSATCGGHGEHNELVWGGAASASLRGRPDLPAAQAARWKEGLADEARLRAFLAEPGDAWCRRPSTPGMTRFRWERRLSAAELDAAAAQLGVGHVRAIAVGARGVSGRARRLAVEGERGRVEIAGELRIRRLLGELPSAMFVVEPTSDGVVLRGGGWGHGAGMCQWGAVGRAQAGQGYREILGSYYSGAELARLY
ncbi:MULTISPECIES: SpoIID/LytB domain-containing protein [Anaeromyxobacter]|uniref:SpoIID/LytB domain-containing protein n=1 Tax=Anaeromyxobacter TaxID=161492 RepID=UPI001F5893BB|nr:MULTISPECIES: SpoIID/LytB domain-containing protein [unclassified Anaeromyxobacter]